MNHCGVAAARICSFDQRDSAFVERKIAAAHRNVPSVADTNA
jgi:hypothetical protein